MSIVSLVESLHFILHQSTKQRTAQPAHLNSWDPWDPGERQSATASRHSVGIIDDLCFSPSCVTRHHPESESGSGAGTKAFGGRERLESGISGSGFRAHSLNGNACENKGENAGTGWIRGVHIQLHKE
jgi:hypothetical protein